MRIASSRAHGFGLNMELVCDLHDFYVSGRPWTTVKLYMYNICMFHFYVISLLLVVLNQ